MRVAWLTPLIHFALNNVFVAPMGLQFPAWLVLALLLGGSTVDNLLQDHPDGPTLSAAAGMAAVFITLAIVFRLDVLQAGLWVRRVFANLTDFGENFPASLIVIVAATAIWRRGMTAAWHDYPELFRGFLTGIVVLGVLMLLGGTGAWERAGLSMWGTMAGFAASALLALAMIGAYEALALERGGPNGTPVLSRYWLTAVVSIVMALIVVGWVAALILSPEVTTQALRLVGQVLAPIWWVVREGLLYVILGIAYVIFWLLGPLLDRLQESVGEGWEQATEGLREMLEEEMQQPDPTVAEPNLALQRLLRIAFVTLLVLGIALSFYFAYRRAQRRKAKTVEEERDYVWSKDLIKSQLQDLLGRMRRQARITPFEPLEGEDPRQAIRRLYQRLLAHMTALGRQREPKLTPRAYARSLADLFPREHRALGVLTDAYLVARYAPDPPTPDTVVEARRALERIEAELAARA
jgi:hypothetical protein